MYEAVRSAAFIYRSFYRKSFRQQYALNHVMDYESWCFTKLRCFETDHDRLDYRIHSSAIMVSFLLDYGEDILYGDTDYGSELERACKIENYRRTACSMLDHVSEYQGYDLPKAHTLPESKGLLGLIKNAQKDLDKQPCDRGRYARPKCKVLDAANQDKMFDACWKTPDAVFTGMKKESKIFYMASTMLLMCMGFTTGRRGNDYFNMFLSAAYLTNIEPRATANNATGKARPAAACCLPCCLCCFLPCLCCLLLPSFLLPLAPPTTRAGHPRVRAPHQGGAAVHHELHRPRQRPTVPCLLLHADAALSVWRMHRHQLD